MSHQFIHKHILRIRSKLNWMQKPFPSVPKQKNKTKQRAEIAEFKYSILKESTRGFSRRHYHTNLFLAGRHSSSAKLADFKIFQRSDLQFSTTPPTALSWEARIANKLKHSPETYQNQPQYTFWTKKENPKTPPVFFCSEEAKWEM